LRTTASACLRCSAAPSRDWVLFRDTIRSPQNTPLRKGSYGPAANGRLVGDLGTTRCTWRLATAPTLLSWPCSQFIPFPFAGRPMAPCSVRKRLGDVFRRAPDVRLWEVSFGPLVGKHSSGPRAAKSGAPCERYHLLSAGNCERPCSRNLRSQVGSVDVGTSNLHSSFWLPSGET